MRNWMNFNTSNNLSNGKYIWWQKCHSMYFFFDFRMRNNRLWTRVCLVCLIHAFQVHQGPVTSILFMSLMPDASSSMLEDRYSYLSSSFSLINSTSLIASSAIIASSPSSSDTLNSWNSCPERKGLCYGIVSNWYSRLRSSWCIWWLNSCFQWSHCSFSFPELPHGLCSDQSDIHILRCERNWWFPFSIFSVSSQMHSSLSQMNHRSLL